MGLMVSLSLSRMISGASAERPWGDMQQIHTIHLYAGTREGRNFLQPGIELIEIYLRRADNIVRDAEAVRMAMVPPDAPGGGRWTLLGQSFGGFCAVIFLSHSILAVAMVSIS
jgi:hypothetical protein